MNTTFPLDCINSSLILPRGQSVFAWRYVHDNVTWAFITASIWVSVEPRGHSPEQVSCQRAALSLMPEIVGSSVQGVWIPSLTLYCPVQVTAARATVCQKFCPRLNPGYIRILLPFHSALLLISVLLCRPPFITFHLITVTVREIRGCPCNVIFGLSFC